MFENENQNVNQNENLNQNQDVNTNYPGETTPANEVNTVNTAVDNTAPAQTPVQPSTQAPAQPSEQTTSQVLTQPLNQTSNQAPSQATENTSQGGYRSYSSQESPYQQNSPYFGNNTQENGSPYMGYDRYGNPNPYMEEPRGKKKREKKEKKSGGFFGKVGVALLVGVIAGASFGGVSYGIYRATGMMDAINTVIELKEAEKNAPSTFPGAGANSDTSVAIQDQVINPATPIVSQNGGNNQVIQVVDKVMPSMVSIVNNYTYTAESFSFWGNGRQYTEEASASGSGIIVGETDEEYLIVTNNHVVEGADSIDVTFADDTVAQANVKGLDSDRDLGIIAVSKSQISEETKKQIAIATLGNSDALQLGEQVVAIGNALGYGQSVTVGFVSALDRQIETEDGKENKFIQTDAAINPGNSGGALLNIEGQVIGINSNKIGGNAIEGMGYAIPISSVIDIINDLSNRQTRIKVAEEEIGYMGITLQEVTSSIAARWNMPEGIYIVEADETGAAHQAGLVTGDIITKFDGQKVSSYTELQNILQYYAAGTTVTITYQRQEAGTYNEYECQMTLGKRPAQN